MFHDIQNGIIDSHKRKGDMTAVAPDTLVELFKPTAQNSANATPCSTDVNGPGVENPETDK